MTGKIKDGGPAFPQTNDSWIGAGGNSPVPDGMSLRDWFAGMAMGNFCRSATFDYTAGACNAAIAERSYILADAMLAEREKVKP